MALAPPVVPQFPAGYGPLPSDFTGWVQNSLGFLTSGIGFRAEMHTAQAIAANSNVVIRFDTIVEDTHSGWNSGIFSYTTPYSGLYQVTLTVCMATNVNCTVQPEINATGLSVPYQNSANNIAGTWPGGASQSVTLPCIGGVTNITGGLFINVAFSTDTVNGLFCTMEINYVSQ